jgi:dTDP-4-dehydrorhamnose reductase
MKRILVLGIKGMAGHIIFRYLQKEQDYQVFGVARNIVSTDKIFNLDVSDTIELTKIIIQHNFDFIVNCIGILNNDAETNPSKSIWYNSFFPHLLEDITKNTNCKVIQISTDCVFNGKKGNYSETDPKDGEGFYAQSKALGELNNCKDVTIRTSIIGPELNTKGIGLFNWFMHQTGSINGYTNAIWSGVTTLELAKFIDYLFNNPLTGVVHLTNGFPISKFVLLNLFKQTNWNSTIEINPYEGKVIDKSLMKSLKCNYTVGSYEEMLSDQFNWMVKYVSLYNY